MSKVITGIICIVLFMFIFTYVLLAEGVEFEGRDINYVSFGGDLEGFFPRMLNIEDEYNINLRIKSYSTMFEMEKEEKKEFRDDLENERISGIMNIMSDGPFIEGTHTFFQPLNDILPDNYFERLPAPFQPAKEGS